MSMSETPLSPSDLSILRKFVAADASSVTEGVGQFADRCRRLIAELERLQSRLRKLEAASEDPPSSQRRSDTTIF